MIDDFPVSAAVGKNVQPKPICCCADKSMGQGRKMITFDKKVQEWRT